MLKEYLTEIEEYLDYCRVIVPNPYVQFHLHNLYEIYFLISGDVEYFVEKSIYELHYGDVMVTNNFEIHKPSFKTPKIYERICLQFSPDIVKPFIYEGFDPLRCFNSREKGQNNKILLNKSQISQFLNLCEKLAPSNQNNINNALKLCCLIEILTIMDNAYLNQNITGNTKIVPEVITKILDYIDNNLKDDLSLDRLGKQFFMDKFHLSRLFRKYTGSTIYEYIIFKRIAISKSLLEKGKSVSEACILSGFHDYANFIKAFTKKVGVPPGKYKIKV